MQLQTKLLKRTSGAEEKFQHFLPAGLRELVRTTRIVGGRQMLQLLRAYRVGWQGIISGYYTTRTMQALFNVGFFDEMQRAGRVDAAAFADQHDLDPYILERLAESLYALRILDKAGSAYVLDDKGKVLVDVAHGWFDSAYGYEDLFHALEGMLRKEQQYGSDVNRRAPNIARGTGNMEKLIYFPLAIDMIDALGARHVLDLGCGDAIFLRELCAQRAHVTGYGLDIAADTIAEGQAAVREAGLSARIHLFVEDVTRVEQLPAPLEQIEVATIFFVLHELLYQGFETAVDFLKSYRSHFPGVPLIVFEAVKPSTETMRKRPGMAVHYFLQHELSQQRPVSQAEWRQLFRAAGFDSVEERYLDFARTAIFTLS